MFKYAPLDLFVLLKKKYSAFNHIQKALRDIGNIIESCFVITITHASAAAAPGATPAAAPDVAAADVVQFSAVPPAAALPVLAVAPASLPQAALQDLSSPS